jgi:hypothetical protein
MLPGSSLTKVMRRNTVAQTVRVALNKKCFTLFSIATFSPLGVNRNYNTKPLFDHTNAPLTNKNKIKINKT